MEKNTIVLYITENGERIALKLKNKLGDDIDVKKIGTKELIKTFKEAFGYKNIVAIMAAGIVVRAVSSLITDKTKDPAIVVVDEMGKFVISLLSGQLGGANELAKEVANILGAIPVITTSSDLQGYKAIDLYAKEMGYIISDMALYRKMAKMMTEKNKISVYVEKCEENDYFYSDFFIKFEDIDDFLKKEGLKLAVSWKKFDSKDILYLIPKRLVLGIGFHKGISGEELFTFVNKVCNEEKLHVSAIKKIATIDKRENELGLWDLSKRLNSELCFLSSSDLKKVSKMVDGSETVEKYHGVGNISEASAILCSNYGNIIVPKKKGGVITLCIALENYL
jgi:cobalamin biosynthesis protein CbiG